MADEEYDTNLLDKIQDDGTKNNQMGNIIDIINGMKNNFNVNDIKGLMDKLPSELTDPLKKVMDGGMNSENMMELISDSCTKMGFDYKSLLSQYNSSRSESIPKPSSSSPEVGDVYILRINASRKVKSGVVEEKNIKKTVERLLSSQELLESPWSALCVGPWKDFNIKVWHCPKSLGTKNRRTSKIMGYSTSSEIVIVSHLLLTEKHLVQVEKLL